MILLISAARSTIIKWAPWSIRICLLSFCGGISLSLEPLIFNVGWASWVVFCQFSSALTAHFANWRSVSSSIWLSSFVCDVPNSQWAIFLGGSNNCLGRSLIILDFPMRR